MNPIPPCKTPGSAIVNELLPIGVPPRPALLLRTTPTFHPVLLASKGAVKRIRTPEDRLDPTEECARPWVDFRLPVDLLPLVVAVHTRRNYPSPTVFDLGRVILRWMILWRGKTLAPCGRRCLNWIRPRCLPRATGECGCGLPGLRRNPRSVVSPVYAPLSLLSMVRLQLPVRQVGRTTKRKSYLPKRP